ncbi:PLDc N-terminal domain-containing protein [Persicobacter diffluens]|uniref:Cardiolipin synthase N-terminal domain-containing protein n=1 Tax=Persicobacter diffluens TaxID=981 RepID=A0AAN5AI95_9BACT|nr:hypothetical protein PEDI_01440 [Persicobacter diffluens]
MKKFVSEAYNAFPLKALTVISCMLMLVILALSLFEYQLSSYFFLGSQIGLFITWIISMAYIYLFNKEKRTIWMVFMILLPFITPIAYLLRGSIKNR